MTAPPDEVARSPAPMTAMLRGAKKGERSRRAMADLFAAQTMRENKMTDPIEASDPGPRARAGPGFAVRRVLPSVKRRMVGPFIFLDHFGPMTVPPGGDGMEVRPHPHIGLATVSYLFEGGIFHRDSLGYAQAIRPGDVNWMTAGRGIAHSERTEHEMRARGFTHARRPDLGGAAQSARGDGAGLPACRGGGLPAWSEGPSALRLIVGSLRRAHRADHALLADLLCRRREMPAARRSPCSPEHAERARLCRRRRVMIGDRQLAVGDLAVLAAGRPVECWRARTAPS